MELSLEKSLSKDYYTIRLGLILHVNRATTNMIYQTSGVLITMAPPAKVVIDG